MPAQNFYVAIELGSSKITGVAAQKKSDGSINVLAVYSEESSSCIRKGVVYNIDKTAQQVRNIVQKLQLALKTEIRLVHVGVGGQGIRSVVNTIVRDFDQATVIDHATIDSMNDQNRGQSYPGQTILDVATQEFKVDSQYQLEPVGIECNRLAGNFLNILWRESFERNLNKCFEQEDMPKTSLFLAPMALADAILTDTERRQGCMLVDMGSGTTTVSIYHKNILRHMVTIPLGSNNITRDIASFLIDEVDAEKLKLKYASAYSANSDIDPDMKISVNADRQIPQREFISVVEARTEEIIRNVIAQIPSEYADKLVGGVVLTGGGSNMKNIDFAFRKYSNIDKIRIANQINIYVSAAKGITLPTDSTLCTALALLAKADEISSGRSLNEATSMFAEEMEDGQTSNQPRILKPGQIPSGFEKQEEERKRKEEEERKRQEEEEAELKRQEEEAERQRLEEEERRRNSKVNKLGRFVKDFFKGMVADAKEDE